MKGISRRVIVVDGSDDAVFEQAIFILSRDSDGVSQQQLVDEAVRIAKSYVRTHGQMVKSPPPLFWAAIGGGGIALLWLLVALV